MSGCLVGVVIVIGEITDGVELEVGAEVGSFSRVIFDPKVGVEVT